MVKSLFLHQKSPQPTGSSDGNLFRLTMAYDGTGRRISKTRWVKSANSQDWEKELVTHYTGIGTEIRESFTGANAETKVVVNMPNGLGRYGIEDAAAANANASQKFEWSLKNHLGSTMLVYGTVASTNPNEADVGARIAAYDYRAFGEMVELTPPPTDKVTENFTGSRFARRTQRTACKSIAEPKNLGAKRNEHDDEIALNYFGARYLDPMLGMWISVDPARQFTSPYLYAGNGMNTVNVVDPDGNTDIVTTKLNEQNQIIISGTLHLDDSFSLVHVFLPDGKIEHYAAPPNGSYFYSENLVDEIFDPDMGQNVDNLLNNADYYWPGGIRKWGSGGELDFKNEYYSKAPNTVGVLNRTIMTARDAGNAIWAGWTRNMYLCIVGCPDPISSRAAYYTMQGLSNAYAVYKNLKEKTGFKAEDPSSSTMQNWGFWNYKP